MPISLLLTDAAPLPVGTVLPELLVGFPAALVVSVGPATVPVRVEPGGVGVRVTPC